MNISEHGLALIRTSEKLVYDRYLCPAGVPTIGYGHVIRKEDGDLRRINGVTADVLLREDVRRFESGVRKLVTRKLTQGQFDALVDWSFNLGLGALQTSTMLKRINGNMPNEFVVQSMIQWNKARVKGVLTVLGGLVTRRRRESELWLTGAWKV